MLWFILSWHFLSYYYSWPCGSRVLFLDPSKGHLPLPDCASVILPLQHVQQSVDCLFGFNLSLPSYNRVSHARSFHSDSNVLIPATDTLQWSFRAKKTLVAGSETWLWTSKSTGSVARWKAVTTPCTWDQIPSEFHREASAQAIVRGSRGETGLCATTRV